MDKIDEINLKLGFVNATIAHGRITKESIERGLKIKQELEEELKQVTNALHNEYLKQYKVEHKDMLEGYLTYKKGIKDER